MSAAKKDETAMVVREIAGWPLAFAANDDEPRVLDVDLAKRLGYAKPRDIRKLIKRMIEEGKINGVLSRATVAPGLFRGKAQTTVTVIEYLLTEAQALKVSAKSETDPADALLDEMIDVFMLARRGMLPATIANDTHDLVAKLLADVEALKRQMLTAATSTGVLATLQIKGIADRVSLLAIHRTRLGYNRSERSARKWIDERIKAAAEWGGKGQTRWNMPADRFGRVDVCLRQLEDDLAAEERRRGIERRGGAASVALIKKATAAQTSFEVIQGGAAKG